MMHFCYCTDSNSQFLNLEMHTYFSSVIFFLSLFYAEMHKKSQVDFKLSVETRDRHEFCK